VAVAQGVVSNVTSNVDAATQLRVAASAGDETGVAAELARGANVDAADAGGQTSLYIAANLGNTTIVSLLINGNADVNKINKQTKFTPLMAAAL
jgi:ankyrin repeat protein